MAQFDTRKAPPDTVWYYAGLNTELLGLILTRATRMHLADYFADRIWQRSVRRPGISWRRARRRGSTGTAIRYGSCPARAGSSRCLAAMGDDPR
jgi:hypothetical protein